MRYYYEGKGSPIIESRFVVRCTRTRSSERLSEVGHIPLMMRLFASPPGLPVFPFLGASAYRSSLVSKSSFKKLLSFYLHLSQACQRCFPSNKLYSSILYLYLTLDIINFGGLFHNVLDFTLVRGLDFTSILA